MRARQVAVEIIALGIFGACSGAGTDGLTKSTGTTTQTQCFNVAPVTGAPAPAPLWSLLSPAGSLPSVRAFHSAALDAANDRMMIFGGYSTAPLNDVWVLANASGVAGTPAWTQLSPLGGPPPARYHALAAYDPASNRLAIYGGVDQNNRIVTDYWVLTGANGLGGVPSWSQVTPAGLPGVRAQIAGAVDAANNRLFAFGGLGCGSISCTLYNDAFVESNASGASGAPSFATLLGAGTRPQPRYGAAMAYDAAANRLVVFGGNTSTSITSDPSGRVADAWVLSNANGTGSAAWSQISVATQPAAREAHTAIYDATNGRLVIFGGAGTDNFTRNDTWTLTTSGTTGVWSPYAANSSVAPRARSVATAVYSAPQNRMIVFGGNLGSSTYLNETWVLRLVKNIVASIAIQSAGTTICATNTIVLTAVPRDSAGAVIDVGITWTSSNPAVVTVGPDGTVTGVAPGTATVTACVGSVCSAPFTITITAAPPPPAGGGTTTTTTSSTLAIPPPQTVTGCVDVNGNATTRLDAQTLIAWGGAPLSGYTWTVTPGSTLPPGVAVELLSGIMKGSSGPPPPLVAGNYNVNMTVSDGSRTATGNIAVQISTASSATSGGVPGVGCPGVIFQQASGTFPLPNAKVGAAYGSSVYVTVGSGSAAGVPPLTWSLGTGLLPPGLVIDQARGVVRGTVTSSAALTTYSFTVSVHDSRGTFPINSGASPITYTITVTQ